MASTSPQTAPTNKQIPELRFKEFETVWKSTILDKIVYKVGSGSTPTGGVQVYQTNGIPFIRSQNVYDDKLVLDETHIPEEIHHKMRGSSVFPNDILLNITGGSIGRSCVVPSSFSEGNVNQHVCIIRLKADYSPKFLQPFLASHKGQKLIYQGQTGSGREGINFQSIRLFKLHLPSLPEQQKIAFFLSAVDEKIQQLTKKKELLEQYKKGVMQQLFSQKLRFKDENGNDYPDWEEKTFGDVARFINGKAYKQAELLTEGKYRVLRVGNLFSNNEWYHSDLELDDDKYIDSGDLIYAWSASFGPRFWREEKVIYHYHIWKVVPQSNVVKLYLFHAFMSDVESIKSQSQGGTMFHITKGNIESRKFNFPHVKEQQKIATYLSSIDTKIEKMTSSITATETFKKGLLQKMFV